jgi:hypothetical protein
MTGGFRFVLPLSHSSPQRRMRSEFPLSSPPPICHRPPRMRDALPALTPDGTSFRMASFGDVMKAGYSPLRHSLLPERTA